MFGTFELYEDKSIGNSTETDRAWKALARELYFIAGRVNETYLDVYYNHTACYMSTYPATGCEKMSRFMYNLLAVGKMPRPKPITSGPASNMLTDAKYLDNQNYLYKKLFLAPSLPFQVETLKLMDLEFALFV